MGGVTTGAVAMDVVTREAVTMGAVELVVVAGCSPFSVVRLNGDVAICRLALCVNLRCLCLSVEMG